MSDEYRWRLAALADAKELVSQRNENEALRARVQRLQNTVLENIEEIQTLKAALDAARKGGKTDS